MLQWVSFLLAAATITTNLVAYNSPNSGGQKFGIGFPGLNESQGRAVLSGGSGKNHFQAHSCQQDSVPQDGRAEVLTSLLLVSWGLLLAAGGHLSSSDMGLP